MGEVIRGIIYTISYAAFHNYIIIYIYNTLKTLLFART